MSEQGQDTETFRIGDHVLVAGSNGAFVATIEAVHIGLGVIRFYFKGRIETALIERIVRKL